MRQNSLVKFDSTNMPDRVRDLYSFSPDDVFVYLGEIIQMPGHCIVIRQSDGRVFCGCHTENFAEILEEYC